MKTLKKRVLSCVMAGVLAVSMAVPAFATASPSPAPNTSTNITGAYVDIVIDVNVPTTGEAQINPYGLPVKLDDDGTNKITGEQIVTKPLLLVNNSDSNLNVSASVTATATGDLRFATAAPTASDTYKSAFVYLQMKPTDLDINNKASGSDTGIQGVTTDDVNAVFAGWKQDYAAAKDLVLNGTSAATKDKMVTLAAATINGSTVTWNEGSIAAFRLAGKVNDNPRDAWVTRDGFTAAIAFTFKPDTTTASLSGNLNIPATGDTTLTVALSDSSLTITSVAWTSATTASATIANATTTTATNTIAHGGTGGTSVITAEVTASNGMTYTATATVTAA